jgi:hypothetical protein
LRSGLLGAVAPGIAFAVALAGCSGNSSVTPPAPNQVNLVAMSATTTTLNGTISAILKSPTGFTLKAGKSCGFLHIYTNSRTRFSGPKPAVGLAASVVGAGNCATSLTATSVKVGETSQTPAPPTSTGVLWHVGDPAHPASGGQCGAATYPTATSANFLLVRGGGCMRNQLNPIGNGGSGTYFLNPGQTYTWTFQTVTHMGIDTGKFTQRLIWQIHQYDCGLSPNTVLGIENLTGGSTGQRWYWLAGGKTFTMPYTEGGTDNWEIIAKIENASSGTERLYRNGTLIANTTGSNFTCGSKPFWNFGPYEWQWVNGGASSSLTRVEILFNNMQLSST